MEHVMTRNGSGKMKKLSVKVGIAALAILLSMAAQAQVSLNAVDYSVLPGNKMQIQLTLSGPAPESSSFTLNDPARLAIDLVDTQMALSEPTIQIESSLARQIRAVEAGGRTRLVLNLVSLVPYEIRSEGNNIFIELNTESTVAGTTERVQASTSAMDEITDIDFRRGSSGEGNIVITLSNPSSVVNVTERGEKTNLDFINVRVPDEFVRRLDVTDFATPVSFIDVFPGETGARMVISAEGKYEHMAYQAANRYVVSFRELSKEEAEEASKDEFGYSGEKLSLNFQNIEVRAVLQLIADFTGMNVVASDTVQGNITLRLRNVPWDQALDIVLKTRGLGMRQTGNVVLIAPNEELVERDKKEMEAMQQRVELAPLRTQFYQVNYARANDIARLLKGSDNSILSARGNVTIDARTNTLMVLDTAEKHEEVARLVRRLDVPVSQVLIESRVVIASDDFSRDLGVRAGVSATARRGSNGMYSTSGSALGTDTMTNSGIENLNTTGAISPVEMPALNNRYNVDFGVPGNAGSIALAVLGSNFLVDLELSALQTEGRGEVISNPRVVTSNQRTARIAQGVQIPYQTIGGGASAPEIEFKDAVLSLEVTPQITPDDRVSMDLKVNKDNVGGIYNGIPSIDTRSVETQVLVDNGDTVVLGGVFEQATSQGESKVPLLGDIPLLGYLFRSKTNTASKSELLIFVTPRILKDGMKTGLE